MILFKIIVDKLKELKAEEYKINLKYRLRVRGIDFLIYETETGMKQNLYCLLATSMIELFVEYIPRMLDRRKKSHKIKHSDAREIEE